MEAYHIMKKYTSPEIEIKAFAVEDIITASAPSMDTNPGTPIADVNSDIGNTIDYSQLK